MICLFPGWASAEQATTCDQDSIHLGTTMFSGNGSGQSSWTQRVFFDPNADRWHVLSIDGGRDLHTRSVSTEEADCDEADDWVEGIDILDGSVNYEDFDCVLDVATSSTTYLHCTFSRFKHYRVYYRRCALTSQSPYIGCNAEQVVYESSDTQDIEHHPRITMDEHRCAVIAWDHEDHSSGDQELYMTRERRGPGYPTASVCGDGVWTTATGFPLGDIQARDGGPEGYPTVFPLGIETYGDDDVQLFWVDTTDGASPDLETIWFEGTGRTFGTRRELSSDIEWTSASAQLASVITGDGTVSFATPDGGTGELRAFRTAVRGGALVESVGTGLVVAGGSGNVAAGVNPNGEGGDDIWLFAPDVADERKINYTLSTDGGSSWTDAAVFVDNPITYSFSFPNQVSVGMNPENCDVMVVGHARATSFSYKTIQRVGNAGTCCGIDVRGDLRLTQDLESSDTCFRIETSDVTLDGGDHGLYGVDACSGGPAIECVAHEGVNCGITVVDFSSIDDYSTGIYLEGLEDDMAPVPMITNVNLSSTCEEGVAIQAAFTSWGKLEDSMIEMWGSSSRGLVLYGVFDFMVTDTTLVSVHGYDPTDFAVACYLCNRVSFDGVYEAEDGAALRLEFSRLSTVTADLTSYAGHELVSYRYLEYPGEIDARVRDRFVVTTSRIPIPGAEGVLNNVALGDFGGSTASPPSGWHELEEYYFELVEAPYGGGEAHFAIEYEDADLLGISAPDESSMRIWSYHASSGWVQVPSGVDPVANLVYTTEPIEDFEGIETFAVFVQ